MKSVMKRRWWPDIAFRYAPHTKKKIEFIKIGQKSIDKVKLDNPKPNTPPPK